MNSIIGVVCFLKKQTYTIMPPTSMNQFELVLDRRYAWEIGIDQSSSCTGMVLRDVEGYYEILLDIHRDKKIDRNVFYRELKYLLRRLCSEQKISVIVHERPVPSAFASAGRVLLELKGKLEDWMLEIPELNEAEKASLYPQTWKSFVVDKSKGSGRFNDKRAVAEDLVDKHPLLRRYFNQYPYSDYDSFDALGILTGYKCYAYNDDGIKQICGTIEKSHNSFACYKLVSVESLKNHTFLQEIFGETLAFYSPKFLAYNLRHNLHDNIRMASSSNTAIYTLLPENVLQELQWTYDFDVNDKSKCLLLFVFRKGNYTASAFKVLQAMFPWNEVICGDI